MRYDTFTAANQFITELQARQLVRHIYEDGDLMFFSLMSGERIMAYLIERPFNLQNLQHHLRTNTARGRYSLFLFYADIFLPAHGDHYPIEDWMQALLAVQGGKIYGFEVASKRAFFFPVYFSGEGPRRYIAHGDLLDLSLLRGQVVQTDEPSIAGRWRVATFDPRDGAPADPPPTAEVVPALLRHYQTLGVNVHDDLATIKKAYRELARQYHPDLNPTPQAAQRMQQINEAYIRLVAHLRG
jgi:hypothetical protein